MTEKPDTVKCQRCGILFSTFNVDLNSQPGKIRISPRTYRHYDNIDDADFGNVAAILRSAADTVDKWWAIAPCDCTFEGFELTTLNPANRTLLRVRMEDVSAADDMFRILMGDKVEPRREFIEKHALEVRNLDV